MTYRGLQAIGWPFLQHHAVAGENLANLGPEYTEYTIFFSRLDSLRDLGIVLAQACTPLCRQRKVV